MATRQATPTVGGFGIGAFFPLRRDPLGFFTEVAKLGDLVEVRVGPRRFWLVSHPLDIEQILIHQQRHFAKGRSLKIAAPVLGQGLLTSEGTLWQRQRRLSQPAFHRNQTEGYAQAMVSLTEQFLEPWQAGEDRELTREMARLTLLIATHTLFGELPSADLDQIRADFLLAMRFINRQIRALVPFPGWFPTPRHTAFVQAIDRLNRLIYALIERSSAIAANGRRPGNLLARLVQARDESGRPMSPLQLRDEIMTLLVAGHETVTNALAWTWYLLDLNPHARETLEAEWAQVLGGRSPRHADLEQLAYTRAVIDESLRLYPPGWMIPRQAMASVTLRHHTLAAGSQLVLSQWVLHRSSQYFPNPLAFLPERWLGTAPRTPAPGLVYFPFGSGPRLCIGRSFALEEMSLILPMVGQRFRLRIADGQRVEPEPLISLRPRFGMRMRLEPSPGFSI